MRKIGCAALLCCLFIVGSARANMAPERYTARINFVLQQKVTLVLLQKKADTIFYAPDSVLAALSMDKMNAWLQGREAAWQAFLANASAAGGEDLALATTYARLKMLIRKSDYVRVNPWARRHPDALSAWILDGQDLNDPNLAKLDFHAGDRGTWTVYLYITYFLDARVGRHDKYLEMSDDLFAGHVDEYKYLLQSDCPDAVKKNYLDFLFPIELLRHGISPEIHVLEPYLHNGFKDPKLARSYDSVIAVYHQLDKGRQAPDFTAHDYNGKVVRLSDLRGRKVVIDMWATWCHGCVMNLPIYDSIAAANKDPNTLFLSLSIDDADSAGMSISWRNFVNQRHLDPTTNLMGLPEQITAMMTSYHYDGVPRYLVIDKDGKILSMHSEYPLDTEFLWALKE